MYTISSKVFRSSFASVAALGLLALSAGASSAQEVRFIGDTALSTFANGALSLSPSGGTGGGLAYTPSTFNDLTSNGFLGLGNAAPSSTNNLGYFTLTTPSGGTNLYGSTFNLRVLFSDPDGADDALFPGMVTGSVASTGNGGVFIDFDNTPQSFSYDGGAYSLRVNDLAINPNAAAGGTSQVSVTGVIRTDVTPGEGPDGEVIPEPGTMSLLGMGAVSALGMIRRRRRNKTAA